MTDRPPERFLLGHDLVALAALVKEKPELLASLADTRDLSLQSFHMVLADLVWQVWYHSMAAHSLLAQHLEPSVHVILRALFETLVGIGYLSQHPERNQEAVIFLAYTHLRDQKEFPEQAGLVADRAAVLARMPQKAVSEAQRRLASRPFTWSGKTIKAMAEEGQTQGYDTLYKFLSGAAHAGVTGHYVKVIDKPDGQRTVQAGASISDADAESIANFVRRALHTGFRILVNTLPGPSVQFPSWDPFAWQGLADQAQK